jgi:hypothetical protein
LGSCACLHAQEKVKLSAQMAAPLSQLQAVARRIAEVSNDCGLEVDAGVSACLLGLLAGEAGNA